MSARSGTEANVKSTAPGIKMNKRVTIGIETRLKDHG
jgi:hypothetical protein